MKNQNIKLKQNKRMMKRGRGRRRDIKKEGIPEGRLMLGNRGDDGYEGFGVRQVEQGQQATRPLECICEKK